MNRRRDFNRKERNVILFVIYYILKIITSANASRTFGTARFFSSAETKSLSVAQLATSATVTEADRSALRKSNRAGVRPVFSHEFHHVS